MGSSPIGEDLLSYPEKFDIALKLAPLRSAITHYQSSSDTLAESLGLKFTQPDHQLSNIITPDHGKSNIIVSSLVQAQWIYHVTKVKFPQTRHSAKQIPNYRKLTEAWRQIVHFNTGHIFSSLPRDHASPIKDHIDDLLTETPKNKHFHMALLLYATDRKILNAHKALSKACQKWMHSPHPREEIKPVVYSCPMLKFTLKMGWDVGFLTIGDNIFALDRDLFLLWINKLGELSCAILYTLFQTPLFQDDGVEKLLSLLKCCSKVMLRPAWGGDWNNQTGFAFPKALEAIGIGMIIAVEDKKKGWNNTAFLYNTLIGLMDSGVIPTEDPTATEIYELFASMTTPEISELVGTVKLMGHPDIDLPAGLHKLYTRTHAPIVVNQDTVLEARGYLIFEFCQRFFQRVGTWPPLVIPHDPTYERLRILVESGSSPLSVEFTANNQLNFQQWGCIEINPCIENDYWESPLEFLKDTAISAKRESVLAYCLKNKLQPDNSLQEVLKTIRKTHDYQLKDSNRLIIQFLLSDDLYWQSLEYRKKWATSPNLDRLVDECGSYWVIKLTPKERELKVEGRFFGASPVCERDRRIQVEGVLAGMMAKMFPEQMLTATELEFNQKLIKFRNYRRLYPSHHVIQLCFDFQAWNNYMRKEYIDQGIGTVLDGIFNTHAYSRIMEFYERALIYSDMPETIAGWDGQLGGIEGLNQATWTLATLTGLKVALSRLGYKFEVSVKGDDCRAAIMIPHHECSIADLNRESNRIKQVLTDYCYNTGMHLKPEETFVSLSLIASSKQYQLDDIILPCGIKQALKMAHHSNTAFPATQDLLSDIMSSCHSACFQTPFIIHTWTLGVLIGLLRVNFDHYIFRHMNTTMITAFGLWPQVLGGPGILPLEMFIVRGENDLLSITLSLYQFILRTQQDMHLNKIIWNILSLPDKTVIHWKLLLSDPYSLNRDSPITPAQFLKTSIRTKIKQITRNPMLQTLMARDTQEGEEFLIDALVSLRPAHMKVITSIYENSCFAVLDKVLARIDNSSSIFTLLGAHKGVVRTSQGLRVLKKASLLHLKQVQWWMNIIMMGEDHTLMGFYGIDLETFTRQCPTQSAQQARVSSWGIPIFGITYPSITRQFSLVPSVVGLPTGFILHVRPHCPIYTVAGLDQLFPQTNHQHPFFSAPLDVNPWIGGRTSTKTILPGYPLLHKSSALPKIERLLEIYARVQLICPQICPLIKWLVRLMVSLSDDDFHYLIPDVRGGSSAHRTPIEKYSMTTTPNYRYNLLQLVDRNYDRMLFTHQTLSKDYTLNFAAINIQHSFILANLRLFPRPNPIPLRFLAVPHQDNDEQVPLRFDLCSHCIADISDPQMRITVTRPPSLDIEDSALIILPDVDKRVLRTGLDVLAEQRQLNIMATLNLDNRGSVAFLKAAHKALVNRMLVESRRHIDELRVTAPGGLLSQNAITALGITYQPFPMKALSWMNPDYVVEFMMHDVVLELLATYPRDDIMDCQVSAFRHRGLTSLIMPVLAYFTKASAHQQLARSFHKYQRRLGLGEAMVGIDIMDVTIFTAWVYRIGIRYIQFHLPKVKIREYTILTTHNETQALLLQQVQPKFTTILTSAMNHVWQSFHRPRGSVLKQCFAGANSPCDVWCGTEDHILEWLNTTLFNDQDPELSKWLHRALILPISLRPSVETVVDLMRFYHSPTSLPALSLCRPNPIHYEQTVFPFTTMNSFMGFKFSDYISGLCPHKTYNLQEFLDFLTPLVDHIMQQWQTPGNKYSNWRRVWQDKINKFCVVYISHMEEEQAQSHIALHPMRLSNFLADTQESLQHPRPLPRLPGLQLHIHQRLLPTAHLATPQDLVLITEQEIPMYEAHPFRWINWNQHLRISGFSGSAACKLWEILYSHHLFHHTQQPGVSLHLADGQGGFCTLIGKSFPNFEVYFNTLLTADSTMGGSPGDWLANIEDLQRLHDNLSPTGDLCDSVEIDTIKVVVRNALGQQSLSLLTFDAERYGDTSDERQDNRTMLEGLAKVAGSLCGRMSVLVIKLFYVPWMLISPPVLYLIDTSDQYRFIKPKSSRESNYEIYLLVKGISYPYEQFPGMIHHRRRARYILGLQAFCNKLPLGCPRSIRNYEETLHNMMGHSRMPQLTIKQIETSLRLPTGSLQNRDHWVHNSIHHRLGEYLHKALQSFRTTAIHQITRGRRAAAIGGVRYVLESTSMILRLRGAVTILNHNGGWSNGHPILFSQWIEDIHGDHLNQDLQADIDNIMDHMRQGDVWNLCPTHVVCLTSVGAQPHWANDPVHLSGIHEFGVGCDIATRIITLGWRAIFVNEWDQVIDNFLRS